MIGAKEPGIVTLVLDNGALVGAGCCYCDVHATSCSGYDYSIFHQKSAVVVQNSIFCGIEVEGEIYIATTTSASSGGNSTFFCAAAQTRNGYATTYC